MSTLANWVMKRRLHAIIGVAAFSAIPLMFWLASAILGLVVLRKGIAEAIPVLAWGGLPAVMLWFYQGDATAFIVLIQVMLLGYLLRTKMSWAFVLTAASFLALLGVFLLPVLMPGLLNLLIEMVQLFLNEQKVEMPDKGTIFNQVVVALSTVQVFVAVTALFLSRKWQAALYNPGGLRDEFHQLRLPVVSVLLLGSMILLGESLGEAFYVLTQVSVPVFVLVGIAIVHGIVAKKRIGIIGLVVFYLVGLFVLSVYFTKLLIVLAVADAFIDIRGRIQEKPTDLSNS
ncbi:hypothetical protein [Marinomonas sp. 2405UD68-3]|uniref:hypothetical protein n=1 Tax=Marinomonas sp. 2405UD68-3 TaxID=3391835 RepID=UPI0039C8D592